MTLLPVHLQTRNTNKCSFGDPLNQPGSRQTQLLKRADISFFYNITFDRKVFRNLNSCWIYHRYHNEETIKVIHMSVIIMVFDQCLKLVLSMLATLSNSAAALLSWQTLLFHVPFHSSPCRLLLLPNQLTNKHCPIVVIHQSSFWKITGCIWLFSVPETLPVATDF